MENDTTMTDIEVAEAELRRLGLNDVQVSERDGAAWLCVPPADRVALVSDPLRGAVLAAVRTAGFHEVGLDLGSP